jgi:hypothetical protein
MKVLFFANRMPDLCGAFLHDIDLATELQTRGHQIVFLTIRIPKEGYNGGHYRGFRFVHYTAGSTFLDTSEVWICPHSPVLPDVRKLNARGYNRPIIATCHFDGNYNSITKNSGSSWSEMLLFINTIMEANYRKHIVPWPPQIRTTGSIRPLMHRNKIEITEPFQGDAITLVNANVNKGVNQFLDIARKMPDRRFLGVLPYYGELHVPQAPGNIEWVPFSDDIRTVLKRTRILLVPSYSESFGRIAVEAMLNGIPTVYSLPIQNSAYPGASSEGLHEWIAPVGIGVHREVIDEWVSAIVSLDDSEAYRTKSEESRQHVEAMNIFTEASRISDMVENFTRQNPVVIRSSQQVQQAQKSASPQEVPRVREPVLGRPGGFGFSNGRLRIQR